MSSLNLTPNPTIMVVQATLFLTSLAIVKKWYLDPYAKVVKRRNEGTTGSTTHAQSLTSESKKIADEIQTKINAEHDRLRAIRAEILKKADKDRSVVISAAEKDAAQTIGAVRVQIQSDLKSIQEELPAIIKSLSEDLLKEVSA